MTLDGEERPSKRHLWTAGSYLLKTLITRNLTVIGSVVTAPVGAILGLFTARKFLNKQHASHSKASDNDNDSEKGKSRSTDGDTIEQGRVGPQTSDLKPESIWAKWYMRSGVCLAGTGIGLVAGFFLGGIIGSALNLVLKVSSLVRNGIRAFVFVRERYGSSDNKGTKATIEQQV